MRVLALKSSLDSIANAIRSKTGGNAQLAFPGDNNSGMVGAIKSLVKHATLSKTQAGSAQVLDTYATWDSNGNQVNGSYKVQSTKNANITSNNQSITPDGGFNAMAQVTAALSGDVVRVHKGVIGPISDGVSLTISGIPFSTILGCVVFQHDRGTYRNGNVLLAYAKSTTEFGTGSDVYYGGSYGSTSPGSNDPVARNLTGDYASFRSNSVEVEFPSSGDNRHLVRGSYAYIVWGR